MSDLPAMSYEEHIFHEKKLVSVEANTRDDGCEFLQLAAEARIKVETETHALEQANEVLINLKDGRVVGTAVFVL
jgi:alcohol dehydrogenase, propanol-preferring